ncbi:MAG: AbrB/MazE/SpoVT family DNA-binding domain-containing protein [Candidatus Omnitrophica bacterium]|nr:AbrB/MazE/SpoVT family DNA-binding domain-containing protein [Candidatus Omnitrophota bacterium]
MTITMTSKNQITLPKRIVDALRLHRGSLFDIKVQSNRIELVPLEVQEREFSDEEYEKLERLYQKEKSSAKKVTKKYIENIG